MSNIMLTGCTVQIGEKKCAPLIQSALFDISKKPPKPNFQNERMLFHIEFFQIGLSENGNKN